MRKTLVLLAGSLCALACGACGGPSGLYPVTGKVMVNGEPAVGATVTFVRKGSLDPASQPTPSAVVAEDGSFTVSGPAGPGSPPGEFVVLLEWKEGAGKPRGRAPALSAPDRPTKKYLDPNHPLLTATVEPRNNVLPTFELK